MGANTDRFGEGGGEWVVGAVLLFIAVVCFGVLGHLMGVW